MSVQAQVEKHKSGCHCCGCLGFCRTCGHKLSDHWFTWKEQIKMRRTLISMFRLDELRPYCTVCGKECET